MFTSPNGVQLHGEPRQHLIPTRVRGSRVRTLCSGRAGPQLTHMCGSRGSTIWKQQCVCYFLTLGSNLKPASPPLGSKQSLIKTMPTLWTCAFSLRSSLKLKSSDIM